MRWIIIVLLAIFLLFGGYNFSDVSQAVNYYGKQIFPSNPSLGTFLLLIIFFFVLFTEEIIGFFKKNVKKIRLKQKF